MNKHKILMLISMLFFVSVLSFANGQQSSQQQTQSQGEALTLSHRVGGYASYEPTIGSLSKFVSCSVGGGFEYELGFPILKIFEIGAITHVGINGNPLTDDRLTFLMNLKADIGCFFRIPLGKSGFVFTPEIDYGILVYFPKANPEYSNSEIIQGAYVDQLVQVGLGFRYMHEKILNGNLEFEITPTYLFSPEQEASIHFIGFRAGALYRIGGTK